MKVFQILLAAMLLVFTGSAFGGDVQIITPDFGDTVNHKTFTVVGKATNFAEGEELIVQLSVTSDVTGEYVSIVYPQGTVNSDRIEIIMPKPTTVSDSPHKFPIVANITEFYAGATLTIKLIITNPNTGSAVVRATRVTTK